MLEIGSLVLKTPTFSQFCIAASVFSLLSVTFLVESISPIV